jgi:hypothetical protein
VDGSPNRKSTPIKIDNPNQFAPQGENPKEYKLKQKAVIYNFKWFPCIGFFNDLVS